MSFAFDGPVLQTERLTLRPPRPEDGDAYVVFFMTERAKYMGGPLDLFESWKAYYTEIGHWGMRGYGMFTVTRRGSQEPLGMVGPWFPHTWPEHEIGWMMFGDAEGQGLAYEAAIAARRFAYDTLGWDGAVSNIEQGNDRSIALAERLGAQLDEDANGPEPDDLVYRHPGPEALQ